MKVNVTNDYQFVNDDRAIRIATVKLEDVDEATTKAKRFLESKNIKKIRIEMLKKPDGNDFLQVEEGYASLWMVGNKHNKCASDFLLAKKLSKVIEGP